MNGSAESLASLIDQVGDLLTDSQHPMDDRQVRELSLMLQQQTALSMQALYQKVVEIQRVQADDRVNRETVDKGVFERLYLLEQYVKEYPSLMWLLRHRPKQTFQSAAVFVVLVLILFLSYQEWLLSHLGFPPILP